MEDIDNKGIGEVLEWAKENQEQLYDTIMDDYLSDIGKTNTDLSIKETLKELNKTKRIAREHEVYMQIARIGQGNDYIGIDWVRWWYQRNLIMYKNIMDLVENDTDRILVIVGSGHSHLLTQFLSESGLVEVEDLNRLI